MVGLSFDVKILASKVFNDATNTEIFLGFETRLRALWLTKEVNKLGTQSNTSKFAYFQFQKSIGHPFILICM